MKKAALQNFHENDNENHLTWKELLQNQVFGISKYVVDHHQDYRIIKWTLNVDSKIGLSKRAVRVSKFLGIDTALKHVDSKLGTTKMLQKLYETPPSYTNTLQPTQSITLKNMADKCMEDGFTDSDEDEEDLSLLCQKGFTDSEDESSSEEEEERPAIIMTKRPPAVVLNYALAA